MNKKVVVILSSALVLLVIIAIVGKKQGWVGKKHTIKVAVQDVKKQTIIEVVSANGKIQPEKEIKISPYISGEVVELKVKEGDEVKKGDFLAKIDPKIYVSGYERAKANLNTQKANEANVKARLTQSTAQLRNASREYKRKKKLHEQKVISDAEYDAAQANIEVSTAEVEAAKESLNAAKYNVKSAKAGLDEAKENLTRTSIYAPTDGTISRLSVEIGERVQGASQFSSGTELLIIANLHKMEVNVDVNENDIIRISLNDTVLIEVDAYFEEVFKGVVAEIATSAKRSSLGSADQVTNFEVKISILPESYKKLMSGDDTFKSPFRPGMNASVDIQTETVYNIFAVPIQSVVAKIDTSDNENENQDAEEDLKKYVFVVDNNVVIQQEVESGIQNTKYIEIKEGLTGDEKIVIAPYRAITKKLKDGSAVEVVDKKKLFSNED